MLQLLNTEQMRKPYRTIHLAMPKPRFGGLSKLFVPSGVKNHQVAANLAKPMGP